jgi:NAD(P)-dependent dehydrogenase (short-subunit alcohol dehydrogenase family)
LLAREGAKIAAVDYNEEAAGETVNLVAAAGGEGSVVTVDVGVPSDLESMVDRARDWLGGLDGVVYNVGIPGPTGIPDTTPTGWDSTMNVNLRGAMLTAQAALTVMDPGSAFVFISSTGALGAGGGLVAYAASKAGLAAVMRHVAFEGRGRSIRANIVMPGVIDTGLARNHMGEALEQMGGVVPLGRPGTAWEIAYATLFLLSHESAYITGQILTVDGGMTTL